METTEKVPEVHIRVRHLTSEHLRKILNWDLRDHVIIDVQKEIPENWFQGWIIFGRGLVSTIYLDNGWVRYRFQPTEPAQNLSMSIRTAPVTRDTPMWSPLPPPRKKLSQTPPK